MSNSKCPFSIFFLYPLYNSQFAYYFTICLHAANIHNLVLLAKTLGQLFLRVTWELRIGEQLAAITLTIIKASTVYCYSIFSHALSGRCKTLYLPFITTWISLTCPLLLNEGDLDSFWRTLVPFKENLFSHPELLLFSSYCLPSSLACLAMPLRSFLWSPLGLAIECQEVFIFNWLIPCLGFPIVDRYLT